MSNLNLATTGKYLTPKERAKLVISFQIKAMSETPPDELEKLHDSEFGWFGSPEIREMKTLVQSCPPHHRREYNFYIDLKQYVWEQIINELRDHLLVLEIMSGTIAPLRYLMSLSPFLSEGIEQLRRLPVVVTKDAYDKAVREAREYKRAEVLALEGSYDVAKQESYYRLIAEKKIEEGDYEAYRDYMENFGRSKDEMIHEKIVSIRNDIALFEKRKSRMGGDMPINDYVRPYIDLTDADMAIKIDKDYEGHFDMPSKEEYEVWVQTVSEERQRLQDAIKQGILKQKENGIEAGSYYAWEGRRQKFAGDKDAGDRRWNPLHESCMEIGCSEGKIVSSTLAKVGDWRTIIAATVHNKDSMGYAGDNFGMKRLENVIDLFSTLTPFVLSEKQFDVEERTMTIRLEEHKKMLQDFVTSGQKEMQLMVNKIALIKAIEDGFFDGMPIVVTGTSVGLLTVEYMRLRAINVANDHNDKIRGVVTDYNKLSHGVWDYCLTDIDAYLLNPEPQVFFE